MDPETEFERVWMWIKFCQKARIRYLTPRSQILPKLIILQMMKNNKILVTPLLPIFIYILGSVPGMVWLKERSVESRWGQKSSSLWQFSQPSLRIKMSPAVSLLICHNNTNLAMFISWYTCNTYILYPRSIHHLSAQQWGRGYN